MSLIAKIREVSAHHKEIRKIRSEIASISDAELNDLGLSWTEFSERAQPARGAI